MTHSRIEAPIKPAIGGAFLLVWPIATYTWEIPLLIGTLMWLLVFTAIFWLYLRPMSSLTRPIR